MRNAIILGVVGAVVVAGVVGCKKKDQDANSAGYQQGGYNNPPPGGGYGTPPPGGGTTAPPPGGGTAPPPAGGTTPPPGGTAPPPSGGGQAQPLDPTAASAATQILNQMATQNAVAGSKPVGSALAGNFQQGQTLESQVQLQAGKCFTVVGAGAPPVTEVNVKFIAISPLPGSAMILAQDQDTGAQATLGKKPNCWKNALPMAVPAKMVLEVAGGSGIAAAQLYEK